MTKDKRMIRLRLLSDEWVVPAVCFGLILLAVVGIATAVITMWALFRISDVQAQNHTLLSFVNVTAHQRSTQLTEIMRELKVLLKR